MSSFEERIRRGEANRAADWELYIAAFHDRNPGVTAGTMGDMRDADGRSSYQIMLQGLAPLKSGASVLEIGCGDGFACDLLTKAHPGVRYEGVDISTSEIARAARAHPLGRFQAARAQSLPFEDGSFDGVFSHLVFMLLPDLDAALWEMARILRPLAPAVLLVDRMHRVDGELLQLHRVAGSFLRSAVPGISQIEAGNNAFNDDSGWRDRAVAAGFEAASMKAVDFEVHAQRSLDDILHYFTGLYVFDLLDESQVDRLREILTDEFRLLAGDGTTVRINVPLKLVTLRKGL